MDTKEQILYLRELQGLINRMPGVQNTPFEENKSASKFDLIVTDSELSKVTKKLFLDGHHARAVEEAFKYVNNYIKKHSGITAADGSGLMKQVFSAKSPIIKLNSGVSQSEQDEQLRYMEIYSGCMTGIRNPRAHEHEWEDSETKALQLLGIANHLVEKVQLALLDVD